MKKNDITRLCMAAMFAALICVATIVIQIPSPIGGFLNFGDCFILIGAWTLGPIYGFAAGAIGSAMADIITGYAVYAPATFVIKGVIAVLAAVIYRLLCRRESAPKLLCHAVAAAAAELWMMLGYYIYDAVVMGYGFAGAAAALPMNAVQGIVGAAAGCAVITLLSRIKTER